MFKPDSYKIKTHVALAVLLLIGLGWAFAQAQTRGEPVVVLSVSSRASANGTVVTILADGPLNRAQTWQDREGYHVVVPSAGTQNAINGGNGIKIRQLDRSLEIVAQTRPGANVTVQSAGNHLHLNVEGKLEPRAPELDNQNTEAARTQQPQGNTTSASDPTSVQRNRSGSPGANDGSFSNQSSSGSTGTAGNPLSAATSTDDNSGLSGSASGESSVMSGTTIMIILSLACVGLLIMRRRFSGKTAVARDEDDGFETLDDLGDTAIQSKAPAKPAKSNGSGEPLAKAANPAPGAAVAQRKTRARMPVTLPVSLYGAYQVDMEIGKLVQGQPHKIDVIGSRAPDDRRAIEASLLKTLGSAAGDENITRRTRGALEEYGFVARQCATLLTAADPYERTSAARMLGDVKSPAALPFLLEALYDNEPLVRNQAVLSIGELKLPSAIGALLDIARKHPDVPGALLSRALSACSVEGLDFFDANIPAPRLLNGVNARLLADEISNLEPAASFADLAETADDPRLVQALENINSEDLGERSDAIKALGQFPVQSAVSALARLARLDPESSLKALAISSLAFINHESVFPAILIAMADESREVRAAAARSLSRLSFDRADGYIRVTETNDAVVLREVADACIKAGIATQSIDKMSSGDHQAYESMAVVSLLVKAGRFEPLLEAMSNHPDLDVRLVVIHVMGLSSDPEVIAPLRAWLKEAHNDVISEALEEAIARLQSPDEQTANTMPEALIESEPEFQTNSVFETNSGFEVMEQTTSESEKESEPDLELGELDGSGLQMHPIA